MERTSVILVRRLAGAVVLAAVTAVAVMIMTFLMSTGKTNNHRYISPNQHQTHTQGPVVTGSIVAPRR